MSSLGHPATGRLASIGCVLLFASFANSVYAPSSSAHPGTEAFEWNAARAEHLFNRAGFGARPEEIEEAVSLGWEATVDRMINGRTGSQTVVKADRGEVSNGLAVPEVFDSADALLDFASEESGETPLVLHDAFYFDGGRLRFLIELREYTSDWISRMISGDHPLRERMTLFWHGHFVSSFEEVSVARDIISQVEFLRNNALGDFEVLVRGISRDPAMLKYLNNDLNVKTAPNENWGRELMELFTLGEGNYTEFDIKQAARAFSGWTLADNKFHFAHQEHDYGPKTVLGVTGNLGGEEVIDIIFEQPACSRFIAGKLLAYFEGMAPDEDRLETYAAVLRDGQFQIDAFLKTLFMDEAFYRKEIVANRIAGPIEYFAGMVRRLEIEPPPDMLFVVAGLTGQRLLAPPNVKGWEEGFSWLTTSSVMQRSNFGGILLGSYDEELEPKEIRNSMVESLGREFNGPYRDYLAMIAWLQASEWSPERVGGENLPIPANASETERIASLLDRVLAVPVSESTAAELRNVIAELQPEADADPNSPEYVRKLLHVILSLPEAQVL